MLATKVVCPFCSKRLKTTKPPDQGHRILCSRCSRSFLLGKETGTAAATPTDAPADPPSEPALAVLPPPVPPVAVLKPAEKATENPARSHRGTLRLAAACVGLLLAAAGAVFLCIQLAARKENPRAPVVAEQSAAPQVEPEPQPKPLPPPQPAPERRAEEPVIPTEPVAVVPIQPVGAPAPPPKPLPRPPTRENNLPPPAPPPRMVPPVAMAQAWLPAEEQAKVNKAIDRGVQFLKQSQKDSGSWSDSGWHPIGLAALPGLTLLECGLPPQDEHIQKAARLVRSATPDMHQTYELALSILFLDRLGEAADRPLIQTLALRLLAGQTQAGGWFYSCPALKPQDASNLLTVLRHRQPMNPAAQVQWGLSSIAAPAGKLAPAGNTLPLPAPRPIAPEPRPDAAMAEKALNALPVALRHLPALREPGPPSRAPNGDMSDNSNTQFAILGVWVAGRHGVPTERALHHIARRFRVSQSPSGGWDYPYLVPGVGEKPSMTGAGLLGLAVGLGLAGPDPAAGDRKGALPKNHAVEKGLRALARAIAPPPNNLPRRGPGMRWMQTDVNLYFLWTLERVGVLYNLRKIGGKDWYAWGADWLVDCQGGDGSWKEGGYPGSQPSIDTSFALLFLKRANFVQDLSRRLEFVIDVKMPSPSRSMRP